MDKDLIPGLVSVVMPAYNAEKYIAESIKSVQQQTFKHWELIVVDDGSTDNTAQIVKAFQSSDCRIVYYYQHNQRLGAARNAGFEIARGEYLAFLDSDDLWAVDKLTLQILEFANHDVDLIFTNGQFLQDETGELSPYPTMSGYYSGKDMYEILYQNNVIPVLSVVLKRAWILKIGKQEESKYFFGCEDWDYWLRMSKAKARFYGMPERLFQYRRHNENMSSDSTRMLLAQTSAFLKNTDPANPAVWAATLASARLLIPRLLQQNRSEDVAYLLAQLQKHSNKNYFVIQFLIKLLRGRAYYPFKVLSKLNRMIRKHDII